jgi:hypothetical protein
MSLALNSPMLVVGRCAVKTLSFLLHGVSCGRSDSLGPRTISNETSKEKDDEVHREVQHPQGFCR